MLFQVRSTQLLYFQLKPTTIYSFIITNLTMSMIFINRLSTENSYSGQFLHLLQLSQNKHIFYIYIIQVNIVILKLEIIPFYGKCDLIYIYNSSVKEANCTKHIIVKRWADCIIYDKISRGIMLNYIKIIEIITRVYIGPAIYLYYCSLTLL